MVLCPTTIHSQEEYILSSEGTQAVIQSEQLEAQQDNRYKT